MVLPDLGQLCTEVTLVNRELCVTMPGGAEVCVQLPTITVPDPTEVAQQLLSQVNSALTPLTPIFNIIDAIIAIKNCVDATVDAVSQLDPGAIIDCIPDLVEAVAKLLSLLPQLSFPLMLLGIVDGLIAFMDAIVSQLNSLLAETQRIAAAQLRADELQADQLQVVIDCAQENCDVFLTNMNAGMAPINRLLALVTSLFETIGIPGIPLLDDLGSDVQGALDTINAFLDILKQVRGTIPL